jgi:ribonucleoside-diphosphate reductase alpha chain
MAEVMQIKKRNGDVVDFDLSKIERAMKKAFIAVQGGVDDTVLSDLASQIGAKVDTRFGGSIPTVEDIQNVVEETMMEKGFFPVARDYIIYRYEHAKIREEKKQEVFEKLSKNDLYVIKRDGSREKFSIEKLRRTLTNAIKGFEKEIDVDGVCEQCQLELYEDIPTKEVGKALVMAVRTRIERDPAYSWVSARLQTQLMYKEVLGDDTDFGNLDFAYRAAFVRNMRRGVELGVLDPRVLMLDLDKMASQINIELDNNIQYLGLQTLMDRYFAREPRTGRLLETPQMFWMRVAMGLSLNELDKEEKANSFYGVMSTLRYVPSTPTLFHSGTSRPQLSSCYLTTIEDDLSHIFKSIGDNAQLSKWSGGIGNDWTNLRGMGAWINGNGVESQGIVPFLKIANDTTVAINRSGKRRGATCAYLETWHYDIEDFLELKRNTGDERRRTHDMNTANWVPDLFMKRVEADAMWTLFSPDETPDLHHIYGSAFEKKYQLYEQMADRGEIRMFRRLRARDLWKKMLSMLFETGHPWITFKDPSNVRSPQDHAGVIHSSNLCTEITLNTSPDETAVCNLGSINMVMHMDNGQLNEVKLAETVKLAMRMLDNVIDVGYYPTKEAKYSNMRHRPVGLGIMGVQDALYLMNINYDSDAAVEFSDKLMELVSYHAILNSSELAKERGAYLSYGGSKWDRGLFPLDTIALLEQERGQTIDVERTARLDWTPVREHVKEYGMRNSNTMAIAPTATIANIAGCFPGGEPIYKNVYVKSNMGGEFVITNSYLVDELKSLGLWSDALLMDIKRRDGNISEIDIIPKVLRDKYKETFDIEPEWVIKAAAYRGKWIDQSQSTNIFLKTTSGKRIADAYFYAWKMGLKTTYYLRTLAATSVEKSTVDLQQPAVDQKSEILNPKSEMEQEVIRANEPPRVKSLLEGLVSAAKSADLSSFGQGPGAAFATQVAGQQVGGSADRHPEFSSGSAEMLKQVQHDGGVAVAEPIVKTEIVKSSAPTTAEISEAGLKLCAIDDPDCEACQ